MVVYWQIRYLNRSDRQFNDRMLFLDTAELDHVLRAAVEILIETHSSRTEREIIKFRQLFTEVSDVGFANNHQCGSVFCLASYFEDETGAELTDREMGQILTWSENVRPVPSGGEPHDIELLLASPAPLSVDSAKLSSDDLKILGYFCRDLRELLASSFIKDGPGTISTGGKLPRGTSKLETATSDEELRSFVTIFRRLYMTNEPANFSKSVEVFARAIDDGPWRKWVVAVAKKVDAILNAPIDCRPFIPAGKCTFTTKRLIDIHLYTQYAHQPDDSRQRQFSDCLSELHGDRNRLMWLFLIQMWKLSLQMGNAGRVIARWFGAYCSHHGIAAEVISSALQAHPGIGAIEKEADKQARLFAEKAQFLSIELWKQSGSPSDGPHHFLHQAHEQLTRALQLNANSPQKE